jgi:hypothetical protein
LPNKQDQTATPVALLSLNICTKSANAITHMLSMYAQYGLHWCFFFYAMDGIVASVTIHQANALSSEKDVSQSAQRNLVLTATLLKQSPLMYTGKVGNIIESIEGFMKKNQLHLDETTIFGPAVFDFSTIQQSPSQYSSAGQPMSVGYQQENTNLCQHSTEPSMFLNDPLMDFGMLPGNTGVPFVDFGGNDTMFGYYTNTTSLQQPVFTYPNVFNNNDLLTCDNTNYSTNATVDFSIDPLSSLLYDAGMPNFEYQNQADGSEALYGNGRKRAQRDWEDPAHKL